MSATTCLRCNEPRPEGSPEGMCARCLYALSMDEPEWIRTGARGEEQPTPGVAEIQPFFPHLEIVRLIGRGGMGAVYEARQRGLHRTVALKLLCGPSVADEAFEARFSREGRALARLAHGNIVSVYDAGKSGPHYWILMEYVDGPNLRQLLSGRRMTPQQTLTATLQMCAALEYAHRQGVVHRDIKPENVLITRQGRVKIADFGLAKIFENDHRSASLTGSLQAMGTPHYVAPEQIETPRSVDHRADIYSLGVVLYEALSGELPLGRFALPSRKASVDPRLDAVVALALDKDPDARYQTVSEFRAAIRELVPQRAAPGESPAPAAGGTWVLRGGLGLALVGLTWIALRFALPAEAGSSAGLARRQLAEGSALLASADTFEAGIAALELAFRNGSSAPEIQSLALGRLREEVDQLVLAGRHSSAAALGRRIAALEPSSAHLELVASLEGEACDFAQRSVRVTSPRPGEVVATSEPVLRGRVESPFEGRLLLDGREIELRNDEFEHVLTRLPDGPHRVELEVRMPSDLVCIVPVPFVVDASAPELTVLPPGTDGLVPSSFVLRGRVVDASRVAVALLGREAVVEGSGDWTLDVSLGAGRTTLVVTATDSLGRTSEVPLELLVDASPPLIDDMGRGTEMWSRSGDDWTVFQVSDDHGPMRATWDGVAVSINGNGLVRVPTRPGVDESAPALHCLQVTDRAGNVATRTVQVWRDPKPPVVTLAPDPIEAFPGSKFTLTGTVADGSPCVVVLLGEEHEVDGKGAFEIQSSVPADFAAGTTKALAVVVRDRADNETRERAELVVLRPCGSCLATDEARGRCRTCAGNGQHEKECVEQCVAGTRTKPCRDCRQSGKMRCATCEGRGVLESPCSHCTGGTRTCTECDSSGRQERRCGKCNGDGREGGGGSGISVRRCRLCDGTGWHKYRCNECDGSKVLVCGQCERGFVRSDCPSCVDGWTDKACPTCAGKKELSEACPGCAGQGTTKVDCGSCRGSGTCPQCHGNGRAADR